MGQKVVVRDQQLHITNLEIERRDVVDFFASLPEEERESRFIHAVELGVFCLQRTSLHLDADFYKRQIEGLLGEVEKLLMVLPQRTETELVKRIGTSDGQVLAPIKQHVDTVVRLSRNQIRDIRTLLDEKIDPDSRRSSLGRALHQVQQMLSPKHDDSVQSRLADAVSDITRHDGALVKAVRKVVKDITDPLASDVKQLTVQLAAEEGAEAIRQRTTLKGERFQLELLSELNAWKRIAGADIDYCGPDNKPGDIKVTFAKGAVLERAFPIIVEAKDDQQEAGKKRIKDVMERAMARRQAQAGVYVTESRDGLAQEIGDWCEGACARGPYVACTRDHLTTALRFLMVQRHIEEMREILPEVDAATIRSEIGQIRTALKKIATIKTQVTAVIAGAENIRNEAEALREDIKGALEKIDGVMQLVKGKEQPKKLAARAAAAGY